MMSEDGPPDDSEKGDVGYRKPPKAMRFTKGQSGNPTGRPRPLAPSLVAGVQFCTVRFGR
jgi:hypothetical protein